MRKVEFLDTSLRDGEQTPGVNFSIKEKIAIAKQLEKWGISAIEAGFPAASPEIHRFALLHGTMVRSAGTPEDPVSYR